MAKKRILIAEDDEFWRRRIVHALTPLAHELIVAHSYHQASDYLEQGQFDLLVTDNQMPPIRDAGMYLMHETRKRYIGYELPVIVHSSDLTKRQIDEIEANKQAYVIKSYTNSDDLIAAVTRLLTA